MKYQFPKIVNTPVIPPPRCAIHNKIHKAPPVTTANLSHQILEKEIHLRPRQFKKYVYLIQSSSPTVNSRLMPTSDRDVLYACFHKNCSHLGVPLEDVTLALNTSWCTGRNALLDFALKKCRDNVMSGGKGYEYFIFLDDDMTDQISGADPWTMFESFLHSTQPGVGYFLHGMWWQGDPSKTELQNFNVDANVNAFHRTTLGALLPYDCSRSDK